MLSSLFFGLLILSLQGLDSHAFKLKILDGKTASITDYPYKVSIQNYDGTNHHCGGTIIDPYYVLTAAHCIDGFNADEFRVVSGTADWTRPDSVHNVSDLIPHEEYNLDDTWYNDIGLIKVAKPFNFGPNMKPASLPKKNAEVTVNTRGVAIGFGSTSENSGTSKKLLRIELTVKEVGYCNEKYKNHYFKKTQICTQGDDDAAIYKGDSGGPFIVDGTVVGIAFTGMAKYPSAFTKVSNYIDWINSHKK